MSTIKPLQGFWDGSVDTDVGRWPSDTLSVHEYGARRCYTCRSKYSAVGLGPPFTRPDQQVWACGTHRHEVERSFVPCPWSATENPQKALL